MDGSGYPSIIATDLDGTIVSFSPTAERMLGYRADEVLGRLTPVAFLDPAEVAVQALALGAELGRTVEPGIETLVAKARLGKPDEREWTWIRQDGSRFPVRLSITALRDGDGRLTGYLGVAAAVVESKRTGEPRLRATEATEAANRSRSASLATISREIRTPIDVVLGIVHRLLEGPLDPRERVLASTVARRGEALLDSIDEILDFSKIESGEPFPIEEQVFSLQELFQGVADLVRQDAEAKHVAFTAVIDPDINDQVRTDARRLRQVLLNLARNGVKFTDRGQVALRAHRLGGGLQEQQLRFEIEDTGIGIRPEDQAHLFRPLTQVDTGASRHRGGAGLGLAISKHIVELMGGQIGVESLPGLGSRFWFELTLPASQQTDTADRDANPATTSPRLLASPAPTPASTRPLRLLVVEDHETNRRLAQFMIESLGQHADFAGNGLEALEACKRQNYDVILMDCQMPEMDGFQAAREIRRRESAAGESRRVRIIALTANALKGDRERCLDAGMDGYISKPFTLQQLRDALAPTPDPNAAPAPAPAGQTAPETPDFDPTRPAQLWADLGPEGVGPIIDDFLRDLPETTGRLAALAQAGQMQDLARLAHSLQGIGLSLGLERLSRHCRALEDAAAASQPKPVAERLHDLPHLIHRAETALRRWLETQGTSGQGSACQPAPLTQD